MKNSDVKNEKVAVLLGGLSKEREISLKSGKAVAGGLREAGFKSVVEIDAGLDLAVRLVQEKVSRVFIALHGRFGEDGTVQGLLEYMKIPYTGSGVLGSALSINKVMTKKIFAKESIPSAPYEVFSYTQNMDGIARALEKSQIGFPMVIKPSCEGSTIGLSVVERSNDLMDALKLAFEHDPEIVVEKFIKGTEVTVGILDGRALPLVEIAPKEGIFDYKSKYTKGLTDYYVPARVSERISLKCQEAGLRAGKALAVDDFGRVDIIVDENGSPYVLEVNSIPGMTETSLIPKAAKQTGISFSQLVEKIIMKASLKIKA